MRKSKQQKYKDDLGLRRFAVRLTAREFVDFDYLAKLSSEERDWLARFSAEYYQSRFLNDGTDLLPKGSAERTAQYGDNNARNRDLWHKANRERIEREDDEDNK